MDTARVTAPSTLRLDIESPGDKSIGHRSLILNAAAKGESTVTRFPRGADTLASLAIIRALGVRVTELARSDDGHSSTLRVRSNGVHGLKEPDRVLNARNSGTTMRLMLGLLAAAPLTAVMVGDRSLRARPMGRVVNPLRMMGAQIWGRGDGALAPLTVRGADLTGFTYEMPVASAQLKSALLIAGVSASGKTTVIEPAPSRDHTERMMSAMGARIRSEAGRIEIEQSEMTATDVIVPGDISSAAPWLVAGLVHPDARITVHAVGINPSRTGILDVLREMGANMTISNEQEVGGEPIADITVESSDLRPVEVGGAIIPRLIDELPVLTVAAMHANGVSRFRDAAELRVKETDRIATTSGELSRMGARVEEMPDGMVIYGGQRLAGAVVRSHGDHRLAMTLAVAAMAARGETTIQGADAVHVSYPAFWEQLGPAVT